MTTAAKGKDKPRKATWRSVAATAAAAVLLLAVALHQILIVVLAAALALLAGALVLRARWSRYRSGGRVAARRRRKYQGWASGRDLRRARASAAKLTRRICPGAGLLILGTARRQLVAVCRELSALYVGPPGYFKSAALACHGADAPGLLVTTSTKISLMLDILPYRDGATWVLNPYGYGGIQSTLAWSPLEGCEDSAVAERRAGDLIDAAPRDPSGKDDHWDALSADMLKFLLHAAALDPRADIMTVRDWASDLEYAGRAVRILAERGEDDWDRQLLGLITTSARDDRYWSAISSGVRAALAWLDNKVLKAAARTAPGEGFSVREFVRSGDSVHLIGRSRKRGSSGPYVTALVAEIYEQVKQDAQSGRPGRRPATFVLDEMPLTCPGLPVHDMLAESREHLATFIMAVQTLAQLRAKYGDEDGNTIRSACPVEVFTGGEKRHEDLTAVTDVLGERDTWNGRMDELAKEPLMPPGALRLLKKGLAVIFIPECKPVRASLPVIWDRPGHQRADLSHPAFRRAPAAPPALPRPPERDALTLALLYLVLLRTARLPLRALEPGRREAIALPYTPALTAEEVPA